MTSTNVNVGIFENRNSSRVLKPPGGGHTQIFGFPEEGAPKKGGQRSSEISGCFKQEEVVIQKTIEAEEANGNMANGNEKKTEEKMGGTPTRKRVPPGGFSSGGFW